MDFMQSVRNTVIYVLGTVPVGMAISLAVAILLNRPLRGRALRAVISCLTLPRCGHIHRVDVDIQGGRHRPAQRHAGVVRR